MIIRGTGYLHREATAVQKAGSFARSFSIPRAFVPAVHPRFPDIWHIALNQHRTNACLGFWAARGAELLTELATHEHVQLSPLAPYYWARKAENPGTVQDTGAYPDRLMQVINTIGFCEDKWWASRRLTADALDAKVNIAPAENICWANAKKNRRSLGIVMEVIAAYGTTRIQRILYALQQEHYVGVAIPVGPEYLLGKGPIPAQEPQYGIHMTAIIDWRIVDGKYEFLNGGSYGSEYGDANLAGCVWLTEELVKQAVSVYTLRKTVP